MNIRFLFLLLSLLQILVSNTEPVFSMNIGGQEYSSKTGASTCECPICGEEIAGQPIVLHGQHSPGCNACLEYALEVSYNNRGAQRFDLTKCPQSGCKQTITLDDMKLIVGEGDLFKKYKTEFEACSKQIKNNNNFSPDEAKMFSSLGAKKCPSCSKFVQKNSGCLIMDCPCKFSFCWVCENDYKKSGCDAASCRNMPDVTLIDAVKKGDEDLVEQLLNKRANPNQIDGRFKGDAMTPLLYAVRDEKVEIVALLIGRTDADGNMRVNVNQADNNGQTPFHYAVKSGNVKIVKMLLNLRNADGSSVVDVNQVGYLGKTTFHYAVEGGNVEIVEMLLGLRNADGSFVFDVNQPDNTEQTAFHYAVESGNVEIVKMLF
jgi:hypothetical protein